ncbi:MAG: lysostaphin resistance A-like protein [Flavobacteriaceae bacterium]
MSSFISQVYKGNNSFMSYFLTLLITFIFWQILGMIPLVGTALYYAGDYATFVSSAADQWMSIGIPKTLYFLMMLVSFAFGFLGLWLGITQIHKRPLKTALTSRAQFDWNRFFFALFFWGAVVVVSGLVDYMSRPEEFELIFDLKKFAALAVVALIFVPIQTSFEELMFRGYFMQALGGLSKNRWLPLIVTSVIFGLLHGANPEVTKLGSIILVYYIGTGFLFGIMTLMDEGLELAMGFHAVNNVIAALFITTNWTVFQTDAILMDMAEPEVDWQIFVPVFILYPIILYVLGRKYGWSNWKEKLVGKI